MGTKTITGLLVKESDKYGIMASTVDVDRDNEIIRPDAFKNLKTYLDTNPVILFGHQYSEPPIAKAVSGRVIKEKGLRLDIEFAKTPFAQEVKYLYDEGFMSAFSVGFIAKKWEDDKEGRRTYTDVELLEVSAVPVPANAMATVLRQAKSAGRDLPTLEQLSSAESTHQGETDVKAEPDKRIKRAINWRNIDMNKIAMLKALIAKAESDEERVKYETELEAAIKEQAKAEVKAELEAEMKAQAEKEAKEAEEQAAAELKAKGEKAEVKAHTIEVGTPDRYKGFRFKYEIDVALNKVNPAVKQRMLERPEMAERVVKHFVDLFENAQRAPFERVKTAINEGTTTEGGYLTPTEERAEILAYIRDTSKTMGDCQHVAMTSDSMTVPAENAKVSVVFTAEASAATEADPTFAQATLTAKRLDGYSVSSNELLADETGGIVGTLLSQFVEAVGQKIDSAVFKGAGTLVDGSGLFLAAGYSEVFNAGSTNFSELLESNIRNLISKIPSQYINSMGGQGKWYVHRTPLWQYFYGLKDGESRPIFIPSYNQTAPHQILGYPVVIAEEAIGTSAVSTAMALFGNLRGFIIGDRLTRINLFVDPYSKSTAYQTMFLMFTRWAFSNALPNYTGRIATPAS